MSSAERAHVLLLGTGVVGRAFLEILTDPGVRATVALAGVANRRGLVLDRDGEPAPAAIEELLSRPTREPPWQIGDAELDALASRPNPVLVDATAADDLDALYVRALARGVHVVTANKKPLVCAWPRRQRLFEVAASRGARLRYEATVGAGLPVIETLKDLVRTGDRVHRVECVLSGTLTFLANALAEGEPLSRAVAAARDRGYTEPDPREDLAGTDVARKAVILARELGEALELQDVALEPFVPVGSLGGGPDTLVRDLSRFDADWSARARRLAARGEKLVYLARIENDGGRVRASAGPVAVPKDHPAALVRGSSALVAFTTARYARAPLVVQGSGAGGPVTAAAVLADVLKAVGRA